MLDVMAALYFISGLGWLLFTVIVVFGIGGPLMAQASGRFKWYLIPSMIASITAFLGVAVFNFGFVYLVIQATGPPDSPLVLPFLIIGIVQALTIWGPTVKALLIRKALLNNK